MNNSVKSFKEYWKIHKELKDIRKQIREYHRQEIIYFLMIFIYGNLCLGLAFGVTRIAIYFRFINIEIISIIFAFLYSYAIFTPGSFLFFMRYITKIEFTKNIFILKRELDRIINTHQKNYDINTVQLFQKKLRLYDIYFTNFFWNYFKGYRRRIKTYQEMLFKIYFEFDKVKNTISICIETNSNYTKNMLSDFQKYLDEIERKILLQILEKKLLLQEFDYLIKKWDIFFQKKYKYRYEESLEYLERYIESQHEKYRERRIRRLKIIDRIIEIIVIIIIGFLIYYFSGINVKQWLVS